MSPSSSPQSTFASLVFFLGSDDKFGRLCFPRDVLAVECVFVGKDKDDTESWFANSVCGEIKDNARAGGGATRTLSSGDMPPLATAVVPPEVTAGVFDCFLVKGRVVAYGLRLVLGEVRMPCVNRLTLDFALALGNDMVACYP
mgnify:FL=1